LSRAQRNVESAFGILSNKWTIFHKPINANLDLCVILVKTCCVLHNFVRSKDGFNIQDTTSTEGFIEIEQDTLSDCTSRATNQSINELYMNYRNNLADYFVLDIGSVSWQTNCI